MNFRQLLTNTRVRLGDTLAQRPSDRTLLLIVCTQVQSFVNLANLSAKPWAIDEVTVVAIPGLEDYAIGVASQFGKPIAVRTQDPSNPSHIESVVEFTELVDLTFDWSMPRDVGGFGFDGSPHSARRIAFFRRGGSDQVWARVLPIPQTTAEYQILYQVGVYGETESLDEIPVLPQFHALIEIRSALDALPHCLWDDNAAVNADIRKELAMSLAATENRLADEFNKYIRTVTVSRRLGLRELYSID